MPPGACSQLLFGAAAVASAGLLRMGACSFSGVELVPARVEFCAAAAGFTNITFLEGDAQNFEYRQFEPPPSHVVMYDYVFNNDTGRSTLHGIAKRVVALDSTLVVVTTMPQVWRHEMGFPDTEEDEEDEFEELEERQPEGVAASEWR
jgi:hypothetical protein